MLCCRGVGLHYFSNRLFWLANGGLLMLSTNRGNSYAKLELPSSGKLATFALSHQSNILSKSLFSSHCTVLKLKKSGGQFNIRWCHFTSKGFPIIKMRWMWEHLISVMEIPIFFRLNWLAGQFICLFVTPHYVGDWKWLFANFTGFSSEICSHMSSISYSNFMNFYSNFINSILLNLNLNLNIEGDL